MCIIDGGAPGITKLDLHFEIQTQDYHCPGIYRGRLRLLVRDAWGARMPPIEISVCIEVKAKIVHSLKNNQLYFHFGDPSKPQSAVIDGQLQADCPVQLMMMTEDGPVDALPCRKIAGSLHQGDVAKDIRIGWRLQESEMSAWRAPDLVLDEQGMTGWRLEARPGGMDYHLECTVTPEAYQPPGDYGQRILVTIQPLL